MATYYVDGALGTDDGSHGSAAGAGAWRTLNYALGASGVPLTGGPHSVNVAAGTYSENTVYGLFVYRAFGSLVSVIGNPTTPANCVIQSSTVNNSQAAMIGTTTNFTMRGFRFQANGVGGVNAARVIQMGADHSNITLEDCEIVVPAGVASCRGFYSAGARSTNFTFRRVKVTAAGTTQTGISFTGAVATPVTGLLLDGCDVNVTSTAFSGTDCASATISGNSKFVTSGVLGISWGYEGGVPSVQGALTLEDTYSRASGSGAHPVLFSNGSENSIMRRCVVDAYGASNGLGFVSKGTNDRAEDCFILCGAQNGLLLKGSVGLSVRRCVFVQSNPSAGAACLAATAGGARQNSGTLIRDTECIAAPGATVFDWLAANHDNTDDVRLLGVIGTIGTNVPSNGYGSPVTTLGPGLPTQHKWAVA